jgi:adenosylhomocysteine nucleosidase
VSPIGILSALPEEYRGLALGGAMQTIGGVAFVSGSIDGHPVVLAECGVGKVNAAMVATLLAVQFGCRGLLFTGVAGGLDPELGIGDVVVARRLVQHDYGSVVATRFVTYQPGNFPLPGLDTTHGYNSSPQWQARIEAALAGLSLPALPASITGGVARQPRVQLGAIVTGDSFVNCEAMRAHLHQTYAAQAVEMEGAAVAQIAERFGLPLIVVRCLSDLAGHASPLDFNAFLPVAGDLAASVARRLLPLL